MIITEVSERALKRPLTSEEYESICRLYAQYFEEELPRSERFRVLPGVKELLSSLSANQDFLLGLATGNFENTSLLKLSRAGLETCFRFGGYGSDSPYRPELVRTAIKRAEILTGKALALSDIYVIGDSVHDVHAGRESGVRTIAVLTGSTTRSDIQNAKPDFVLENLSDAGRFFSIFKNHKS